MIQKHKKKILLFCRYFTIVVLTVIVTIICLDIAELNEVPEFPKTICMSTSTDGKYKIEIITYGVSSLFGPEQLGLKIRSADVKSPTAMYDILQWEAATDGGMVDEDNFHISWNLNTVIVTMSAIEQPDVTYKITFYEDASYTIERKFAN